MRSSLAVSTVMYRVATWLGITGVRLAGIKIEVRGLENMRPCAELHLHVEPRVKPRSAGVSCRRFPAVVPCWSRKKSFVSRFSEPRCAWRTWCRSTVTIARRRSRASAPPPRSCAIGVHMVIFRRGYTLDATAACCPSRKAHSISPSKLGVPVVPVTLLGTYECWPKGQFASRRRNGDGNVPSAA